MNFKANKDKQLLYGPFLIPNMLIYRKDDENGEYYVRFSAEQIEKIAEKFNSDSNHNNTNFMHTEEKVDAFVAQNWLIENDQDKSRNLGFDLPAGTWFGAVKVKDADFWLNKVKNDEVNGFSVEILADLQLSLKNKETIMEKQMNFGQATLKGGTEVYYKGDFGMDILIYVDEEMTKLAPDADHVLEDGTVVTTVEGKVKNIEVSAAEDKKDEMGKKKDEDEDDYSFEGMITAEEVSMMIDSRFNEIMEEITALKSMIKDEEKKMTDYKKQTDDKFASVPATASIKKVVSKVDDKFATIEARIREFAKNNRK